MKKFYKDADIGQAIDVKFETTSQIAPNIRKVTEGWTLVPTNNQLKQVWNHINYPVLITHSMVIYTFWLIENISLGLNSLGINIDIIDTHIP